MTTEQLARNLLAIIDSEMYVNDFGGLQAGRDATTGIHAAMGKLEEALAQPEQKPTYTSTQSTNCASCGEHKHTPPRIDAMGGYVCLTCIDKKLGALLGEFGYAQQPEQREWVGQTDSGHTLKTALLNLEVDANAIFNYPPNETSQNVRNVINWYAASIRTFTSDEVEPLGHMDALRLADEIDPLTRKAHPDNLTMSCAAKVLRILAQPTTGDYAMGYGEGFNDACKPKAQPEQELVAWQNTANHMEIVLAEDWENIDPMWHWMYRPLYTTPPQRQPLTKDDALKLAKLFHTTYERLAPEFGYETRTDTKVFDPLSSNGRLMLAVCSEILAHD